MKLFANVNDQRSYMHLPRAARCYHNFAGNSFKVKHRLKTVTLDETLFLRRTRGKLKFLGE